MSRARIVRKVDTHTKDKDIHAPDTVVWQRQEQHTQRCQEPSLAGQPLRGFQLSIKAFQEVLHFRPMQNLLNALYQVALALAPSLPLLDDGLICCGPNTLVFHETEG